MIEKDRFNGVIDFLQESKLSPETSQSPNNKFKPIKVLMRNALLLLRKWSFVVGYTGTSVQIMSI